MRAWLLKARASALGIALLLLMCQAALAGTASLVQSKSVTGGTFNAGTGPHNTTFTSAVTAGNCEVVWIRASSGSDTIASVIGNVNGSFTRQIRSTNAAGSISGHIWYKNNISGGSETITVTTTGSGSTIYWAIAEVTGQDTSSSSSCIDVASSTTDRFTSNTTATSAGLTSTVANDLVIGAVITDSAVSSIAPGGSENELEEVGASRLQLEWKAATTTGSYSLSWTLGSASAGQMDVVLIKASTSAAPTFTSAPAIGTVTTTTIPINFTLDQTGTVYGIAQATGATAPTCTQVKAGQNGGGTSAIVSWSEAVVASVADAHTFTVSSSPYDLYFCGHGTSSDTATVPTIANAFKIPVISSATYSATSGGGTVGATSDSSSTTLYCIARNSTSSAFTAANVISHSGALAFNSVLISSAGAGTMSITGLTYPLYDYDCAGSNSGGNSNVLTQNDKQKSPATGTQYIVVGTLNNGSVTQESVYHTFSPPPDVGDIIVAHTSVTPCGASCPLTISTAGDIQFPSDGSRQYDDEQIYKASGTGAGDWIATDDSTGIFRLWFNNKLPIPPPTDSVAIYIPANTPMIPFDLRVFCPDPDGDAVTVTAVDPPPTGTAIVNSFLQGTATVPGVYSGRGLICTDATGASIAWH